MCDYAFVIIAYVSVSLLHDLKTRHFEVEDAELSNANLTRLVHEVAALMQSYGGVKGSRVAIYGNALNTICESMNNSAGQTQGDTPFGKGGIHSSNAISTPLSQQDEAHHPDTGTTSTTSHPAAYLQASGHTPSMDGMPLLLPEHQAHLTTPSSLDHPVPPTSHITGYLYPTNMQARSTYPYFDESLDYMDVFNDLVGMSHMLPGAGYNPLYIPDPEF